MSERKNFSNDRLNEMLTNYFAINPDRAFVANFENKRKTVEKNLFLRAAAVCACAAVVAAGVFSIGFFANNDSENMTMENSFTITAYADEKSIDTSDLADIEVARYSTEEAGSVILSTEKLYFLNDEEKTSLVGDDLNAFLMSGESTWNGYEVLEKEDTAFTIYCVFINVEGENIETYDVECETGDIINNCFTEENNTKNIVYDGKSKVEWSPTMSLINEEIFMPIENGIVTYDTVDRRVQSAKDALQTSEDYTHFFGDTITVTAHFENGTSQTLHAVVTLGDNGEYQINYE